MKGTTSSVKDWLKDVSSRISSSEQSQANAVPLSSGNNNAVNEKEIKRLETELVKCRAEIGKLRNSSRHQKESGESILENVSCEEPNGLCFEGNNTLFLSSPRSATTLPSGDELSYKLFEKKIEADMNLECRKENLLLKAALERANNMVKDLQQRNDLLEGKVPFESEIDPIEALSDDGSQPPEGIFLKIANDLEKDVPEMKLDDPALEKELEEYKVALLKSLNIEMPDTNNFPPSPLSQERHPSASSDQQMINAKMLDSENFLTEWSDLMPPLPPPPDHGLRSPIVDAILNQWTDDMETKDTLISWIESILEGTSPEAIPPLKLSGLSHQIRDGFVMHVLPLLLIRKDVHVHTHMRAHRQTLYDIAVTLSTSSAVDDKKRGAGPDEMNCVQHRQSNGNHHLMAYRATQSGALMNENNDENDSPECCASGHHLSTPSFSARKIPGLARSGSNSRYSDAGSISTAITSPISNRTPTKSSGHATLSYMHKKDQMMYSPYDRDDNHLPRIPATSASLGDDLSVASSADESEHDQNYRSDHSTIWGAFGGILSRRKTGHSTQKKSIVHSRNQINSATKYDDGAASPFLTPQRASNNVTKDASQEQPYHRVVSAPAGKLGITFVEYRGHAMVSNVSEESPLHGFVFQGDILIAIDEIPVSGLRTRDIVKLLTAKKDVQRALRMISSHGMNELIRPGSV